MTRKGKKGQKKHLPGLRPGFVLAVDIVEYSLRSTIAQSKMIQQLVALVESCDAYRREQAKGELIPAPSGDGFIIAFLGEMLAPIECARQLRQKVLETKSFRVRQAIHIGSLDEVEKDIAGQLNIAGEAVNMAVRALKGCAPDEIVLTQRAIEFVRESPDIEPLLSPLGEISVKHGHTLEIWRLNETANAADALSPYLKAAKRAQIKALHSGLRSVASVRVIAFRLKALRRETLIALTLIPIATFLHLWIEHSMFGRKMRLFGYETLQSTASSSSASSPVTFVDIAARFNDNRAETDHEKLRFVLDEIAALRPAAIALDIDFGYHEDLEGMSGERGRYLDEKGIVVKRARELTDRGIPVFLAVYKGLAFQNKDDWLTKGYSDLVVHPLRPSDALIGQIVMLGELNLLGNKVPALSSKLSEAYRERNGIAEPRNSFWLTRYSEFGEAIWKSSSLAQIDANATLEGPMFLLNIDALSKIKKSDLKAFPEKPILRGDSIADRIRGNVVIIGATNEMDDSFSLPTTGQREWGPYFHALATYTEIAAPIYEITFPVRVAIILLTALGVLMASQFGIRRLIAFEHPANAAKLTVRATWIAVSIILVGGIALAKSGILYTEYILVAVLLAVNPWFDQTIEEFLRRLASKNKG